MKSQISSKFTAATARSTSVASSRRLIWVGDDIGLSGGNPVWVQLRDTHNPRGVWFLPLEEALAVADDINEYGLQRIVSSLVFAAAHGHLCAEDLDAWREADSRVSALLVEHH